MDNYNIDSHKLMYHPERVGNWLVGNLIQPIYMEVSPSGACNHRCRFCALDYLNYKPNFLDVDAYNKFINQMVASGLKSVMFGGEGEPLMHRQFARLLTDTFRAGVDCAITTNGVLMIPELLCESNLLDYTKWVKISVDAGDCETYMRMHGTNHKDWDVLWRNIRYAVDHRSNCKIGLQFLLLPDNKETTWDFLKLASNAGVDYVVFKQYSQNLNSKNTQFNCYLHSHEIADMRKNFLFDIIVREDRSERNYEHCLALPFWRYLQANGDLWACSAHIGDERFKIGKIALDKSRDVYGQIGDHMHGTTMIIIDKMMETFDISNCRLNCRMNNCNEYLHRLKYPKEHDNFI